MRSKDHGKQQLCRCSRSYKRKICEMFCQNVLCCILSYDHLRVCYVIESCSHIPGYFYSSKNSLHSLHCWVSSNVTQRQISHDALWQLFCSLSPGFSLYLNQSDQRHFTSRTQHMWRTDITAIMKAHCSAHSKRIHIVFNVWGWVCRAAVWAGYCKLVSVRVTKHTQGAAHMRLTWGCEWQHITSISYTD